MSEKISTTTNNNKVAPREMAAQPAPAKITITLPSTAITGWLNELFGKDEGPKSKDDDATVRANTAINTPGLSFEDMLLAVMLFATSRMDKRIRDKLMDLKNKQEQQYNLPANATDQDKGKLQDEIDSLLAEIKRDENKRDQVFSIFEKILEKREKSTDELIRSIQ